jgi:Pyridoxamine 5'-phosphate oxidase
VLESERDVAGLQRVLDESFERAGRHLLRIFTPERRLSAGQIVSLFPGVRQVALATVTARGEPRVAPIDALLLRGGFYFGTSLEAARIRHLRLRPAVSLTYFEGDRVAVIAHGKAELLEFGNPDFEEIDRQFLALSGGTASTEEERVVFARVRPTTLFAFARAPARIPTGDAGTKA